MTTAGRHAATCLALAVLLTLLVAGPLVPSASASDEPEVRLRVTELSGVLGPGSVATSSEGEDRMASDPPGDLDLRLLVENTGEQAVNGMRLVVEVHPAVGSPDELTDALDEQRPATFPMHVHDEPIRDRDALEPGDVAGLTEQLAREELSWAQQGGVHPVRIAVVRGSEVLDEAVTGVIWLPETPEHPLLTTAVWPVNDAPWRTVRGHYDTSAQRDVRPGGRLDVLLRPLEQRPDAGVLLAPSSHLLEDLDDQSDGFVELERKDDGTVEAREVEADDRPAQLADVTLERIREIAASLPHAPPTGPYADADLSALVEHGQTTRELAGELTTDERRRLRSLLERSPDASTTLLAKPVDERVLDLVRGDHLLLPPTLVEDPEVEGVRPLRSPSGGLLTATVGDPELAGLLAEPDEAHGGLISAQRVLAETAARYFADPEEADRVLALHPPPDWAPESGMVEHLVEGLAEASWLELVSPSRQAASGTRTSQTVELLEPDAERLDREQLDELESVLADLESAQGAQPTDLEEPPPRDVGDLRDTALRATSQWYEGGGESDALLRDVRREIERTFGDIEVASGSRVTLTAESGQIPITLRRTRGGPLTVRVEVASQGRLVWPDGRESEELVLTDREAHTVSFRTRALSTGTFPVTVRVTDPSGERELERTTLSVRSTAVSGPALTATGGVVLVLLLAGALRRRPRGPRLEAVPDRPERTERPY